MSQLFESDDIKLDANRYSNKEKIYKVALLVSRHAEIRRDEYRLHETQGVYPDSEFQLIKSRGALTQIYYSKKYWSDFIPWYEWMSEPSVLKLCAKECGFEIWELANFITEEFKPKNWQVFCWMALAYELSQHGSSSLNVLNEYVVKLDEVLESQRSRARLAGLASGQTRRESAELTPKLVAEQYQLLMATGTEERNVASKLASRYEVTSEHIRNLRKKANK